MTQHHPDQEVNAALVRLLDALCEHERNTGRRSTLVLVPHALDERVVLAQDGKPFSNNPVVDAELFVRNALTVRNQDLDP